MKDMASPVLVDHRAQASCLMGPAVRESGAMEDRGFTGCPTPTSHLPQDSMKSA